MEEKKETSLTKENIRELINSMEEGTMLTLEMPGYEDGPARTEGGDEEGGKSV